MSSSQVKSKSEPLRIILEAQYRPSQDAVVVEVVHMADADIQVIFQYWKEAQFLCGVCEHDWLQVPAGLIDQGEDAAQAAVRELKEETGTTTCFDLLHTCQSEQCDVKVKAANLEKAVNRLAFYQDNARRSHTWHTPCHASCLLHQARKTAPW